MVLNCDFCRAEINNNANNDELPPSIYLFPCFHRHCDRCRCAAYQQNGRVVCKVCGCQCLPKHIYDYVETPLDRIYCMFCNIKNRAQVEWRCETCQKSYMCNVCTKPHVVSGHTLTHVKMYVPTHSQCHSHLNLSATYLCSCQTRLCVHCLNIHANGQLVAPHEQRYPFAQLADQARQRIQTIRTNSQREMEKAQKILPVLERNKKFVHEMASKARSAVADQIVELCNALIRRGNDIVTHIDLFEQEKLQKYEAVGTELKRVVDHYRKIEEFSENALVTAQNDHPGMFSASEFAQNSVSLISKKLETLQQDVELTQRLPKISYQSDLTQLIHSIQNLGVVDVDGNKTVPMLTTPQNAKMFTVTNAFVTSQQPGPSAPVTTIRPNLSILNPPNGGQTVMANVTVSAVPTNPFNVPLPPNVGIVQPTQHQQLVNNGRIMSASHVPPVHLAPTSVAVTGVLSHLLQQGVSSVVTAANNSQPNTPTTPNFPQVRQPLQHQAVNHHQQQQIIHQQQQNQLALHQQQMTQMQRQQAVRNQQMMCQQQQQQHHFLQQQQQYLQQPQAPQQTHNQTVNIHQNQVLLKQLQAQQQLFQQQQQQQRQFIQQHHSQSQASVSSTPQVLQQNASVSTATDRERRLLLRFPNPFKQQAQQQQIINPVPSGSPIAMPQIASPSQTHQMVQQRGELNPIQQQQVPLRQSQKNPIVVELMDDDEEETDKTNKQKQIIPQNQLSNEDRSILLTSYQQNLKLNHPQISRAAADSTVNAGNGSSDDSSASPCPSSSVPKRPATLPIHVPEPSHKRLAIENSHNITAIDRIALNTEEGSTRSPAISPAISTTMAEGNAKEVENEVQSHGTADDGSASHQTDITLSTCSKHTDNESNQGHREKENIEQSDHCIEEQPQLTSNADQNTELNTVASPPETSEGELQEDDQWDDYCYVCSQGCDETTGSLGCCKTCPKVFHAKCHVPMFSVAMEDLPDDWQCTLCLPCDPLIHLSHSFGKREKLLCAKVYLNCFATFSNVEPFLNAVSTDESDYYAVIREPIWLNKIARKISSGEYKLIAEFVEDMNLLFRNCSTFNLPTNSLSSSGKKVYTLYMEAMREFLPAYEKNIWIYVSLYSTRLSVASSNEDESVRRRYSRRGGQKAKSQTPG